MCLGNIVRGFVFEIGDDYSYEFIFILFSGEVVRKGSSLLKGMALVNKCHVFLLIMFYRRQLGMLVSYSLI